MSNKNKNFKISLGILVGYSIATLINMIVFDKNWIQAVTDKKLLYLLAAVVITGFLIKKRISK
jgi:hypothetical protein